MAILARVQKDRDSPTPSYSAAPRSRRDIVIFAVVLILLIAFPFIDQSLGFHLMGALLPIGIYALLAMGLNIVVGYGHTAGQHLADQEREVRRPDRARLRDLRGERAVDVEPQRRTVVGGREVRPRVERHGRHAANRLVGAGDCRVRMAGRRRGACACSLALHDCSATWGWLGGC